MEFYLRCFVEVDSEKLARQILNEFKVALQFLGPVKSDEIKPYWKIAEYQEIFLSYILLDQSYFNRIITSLGTGWIETSKQEAIWNPSEHAKFINNRVRWAQIEIIK